MHGPYDRLAGLVFLRLRLCCIAASKVFLCQLVLLLGQLQRIGLPAFGIELRLQSRDLSFECFDFGIALRRAVEILHLCLHGAVGGLGPLHGIIGRRLFRRFQSVVQQREGVVAERRQLSVLRLFAADALHGFLLASLDRLFFAVGYGDVDAVSPLGLPFRRRTKYEPYDDQKQAAQHR